MKSLFKKYGHGLFAIYLFIYLPWFFYLEGLDANYHIIHCFLDDYIPFKEIFIIPYLIWYFYIILTCIYMFFRSERGEFYRFAIALTGGMTVAMIIFWIYPSCVDMRPVIEDTNLLTHLILALHAIDTSTNVCPSIHVFNSVVACVALWRNPYLHNRKIFQFTNILLCVLICLSTVFLKQHSVLDIFWALVEYIIFYLVLYVPQWKLFQNKEVLLP